MSIWQKIKDFLTRDRRTLAETFQEILERESVLEKKIEDTVEAVEEKVEAVKKETKRRVSRVKEEVNDVVETVNEVVEQAADVVDAAKGGTRKARKKKQ